MKKEYVKAISRLTTLKPKFFESSTRLEKFRQILSNFNHPQLTPKKFIHVGGTNGKGSVSMKIAKALQLSGYKTGLFTSPHLFSYRQRIKNSTSIPIPKFLEMYDKINPYIVKYGLNYFEATTMMALVYYDEEKCDKIVLQVGVGGTLDTTNVIDKPLVSVITSIGLDHVQLLGDSLTSIARNKSGIIKQGCPSAIGINCFPESVFYKKAKQMNSCLYQPNKGDYESFQDQNNALVSKVFQILQDISQIKFTNDAKQKAFEAKQQCRKQLIPSSLLPIQNQQNNNLVFLDVGHNPAALNKLFLTLKQQYSNRNFVIIYGTSGHKDSTSTIHILKQFTQKIYFIQASHFRAMSLSTLKRNAFDIDGIQVIQNGKISATIKHALENSQENDIIVVCGSFFIMGEAKGYFYPKQIASRLDPTEPTQQQNNDKSK